MLYRMFSALALLLIIMLSVTAIEANEPLGGDVEKLVHRSLDRPYSFDNVGERFIVISRGMPLGNVEAFIESSGGKVVKRFKILEGLVFEGRLTLAEMLKYRGFDVYRDRVLYLVEPLRLPMDNSLIPMLFAGTPAIGADRLKLMGYDGSGVRVAVIDTGIENLHPWLIRDGESVVEWEVDATQTGIIDYCGKRIGFYWGGVHGTHIAGIIASQHPKAPGVAPGVTLYDIIVFPEIVGPIFFACFQTTVSYVIAGIELALLGPDGVPDTGDEADVISLSLGAVVPPEIQYAIKAGIIRDPLIEILEKTVEKGKVVVIAAGNNYGLNLVNYLCLANGVICVGASSHMGTPSPEDDMLAWFSSKGPGPLGILLPHVVAPGVYVYSSIPTDLAKQYYLPEPADRLSGTSMSTPFVSGSAALLINYYRHKGVQVDPKTIQARLVQTGLDVKPQGVEAFWLLPDWYKEFIRPYIPIPPLNTPVDQGGGLINVYNAALAELELSIKGNPVGYVILDRGSGSFNITVKNILNRTLTVAVVETLVKVWNVYTFNDVSAMVRVKKAMVSLTPDSKVNVTVNILDLEPGIYSGYIGFRVIESGHLYRIPVLLVSPIDVVDDRFRVLHKLELMTGTRDVWDVVTLYVNVRKPIIEPLVIVTFSGPGAPGMISVTLTTPSGKYTSFTNTMGYALLESGFYTLSAWILFAFEWPINVEFTLTLGIPTLTERVREALEDIRLIANRVTFIESLLATIKGTLETLREELRVERGRITTLNQSLIVLDTTLRSLGEQLRTARGDLERLTITLSNVNTTLSQRITEEARRLKERIDIIDVSLQKTGEDLRTLRSELNTKAQELNSRIKDLEGAHSITRIATIIAILIGLAAVAIGAYSIPRWRSRQPY